MEGLLAVERELEGGNSGDPPARAAGAAVGAQAAAPGPPPVVGQHKSNTLKGSFKRMFSKKNKDTTGGGSNSGRGGSNNAPAGTASAWGAAPGTRPAAAGHAPAAAAAETQASEPAQCPSGGQGAAEGPSQQHGWHPHEDARANEDIGQQPVDPAAADQPSPHRAPPPQQQPHQQWQQPAGPDVSDASRGVGGGDDGDEAASVRYDRQGSGNDGASVAGGRDSRMSTFGGSNMGGTFKGLLGPRAKKTKQIELDALRCGLGGGGGWVTAEQHGVSPCRHPISRPSLCGQRHAAHMACPEHSMCCSHHCAAPCTRLEMGMLQERCSAAENNLSSASHDVNALRADRDALQQQVRG